MRKQQNGQTWQSSKCSVPLGIYFDNNPDGPTNGTNNIGTSSKFLAGPAHYIFGDGKVALLDTLFIATSEDGEYNIYELVQNGDLDSTLAIERAEYWEQNSSSFVAVSGTSLYPELSEASINPDSGGRDTTRIGFVYSKEIDAIIMFQGGYYGQDLNSGVNRRRLADILRYWHPEVAIELDGGGSSALVLREGSFSHNGAPYTSSCSQTSTHRGAWCSPIRQPDGNARPVPGWLALTMNIRVQQNSNK